MSLKDALMLGYQGGLTILGDQGGFTEQGDGEGGLIMQRNQERTHHAYRLVCSLLFFPSFLQL